MTLWLLAALAAGLVAWLGRRAPVAGWRRAGAIGCRIAALLLLVAALAGGARRTAHTAPRHLIYLVDVSASLDEAQRAWIARRIASLEAERLPEMPRALVAFAAGAAPASLPEAARWTDPRAIQAALDRAAAAVDRSATNVEAALLSLAGTVPAGRQASVLLFSDGRETTGNVAGVVGAVHRLGFSISPVTPPLSVQARAVWERLEVPPSVQPGASIPVQLVVRSSGARATPGEVAVALQGVPVKRQRISIRPGWQVFTVSVPAVGRGSQALEVALRVPEHGLAEQRRAYTEVVGPPRILLVQPPAVAAPPLAAALQRRQIDVAFARPSDVPDDPARLLDYDAVLLFGMPKSALTAEQAGALDAYVRRLGGGLVMAGLGGELAHEVSTPAPLDSLLPVRFEPKGLQESTRRVCMILLIDRSASMLGPRIAATKRAAIALLNQLAPEDLVGVLAFDVQPYIVAEVQPAARVTAWIADKLASLRSSGGTDIYPALAAAHNRLELTGATVQHIILLSDGNTPVNEAAYRALFAGFRRERVTVSAIGVGAAFINDAYLGWVARETGGTYYQLRSLNDLPRLVARDAEQATGRLPFAEGRVLPQRAPETDWFADVADWPPLKGYLTATVKPGAQTDLVVNTGQTQEPLLARWWVGQGRVASFLSDADTRWSPDWVRWPGFGGVWAQILRWAMRPRLTEELFVRIDESGRVPQLILEGLIEHPHGTLISPDDSGTRAPLSLIQTGRWSWQASLDQVPSGWYQLALEMQPSGGTAGRAEHRPADQAEAAGRQGAAPLTATRWVLVGTPPSAGREQPGQPPQEALLRQIARATAGSVDAPDRALLPPTSSVTATEPLLAWWLPAVLLLLLADVALRGGTLLG